MSLNEGNVRRSRRTTARRSMSVGQRQGDQSPDPQQQATQQVLDHELSVDELRELQDDLFLLEFERRFPGPAAVARGASTSASNSLPSTSGPSASASAAPLPPASGPPGAPRPPMAASTLPPAGPSTPRRVDKLAVLLMNDNYDYGRPL